METIIRIQDKQIAAELAANRKHGKGSVVARKVILSARTRAKNALLALGFNAQQAKQIILDAAEVGWLQFDADSETK
jgi:Holliday junction resolvasome RuvABC DNA-binding subunit